MPSLQSWRTLTFFGFNGLFLPVARIWRHGWAVFTDSDNDEGLVKLSPRHPQDFVDNLLMDFRVGRLQRREIKQRRGLQPGRFDYNEVPTSSCQSFCWKARQSFDVPFF
jgi:hypothetical protein